VNSQRLRLYILRKQHRQRVISLVTLLAFIACLFPIALPRLQSKPSGTPFPCQNSSCGCQTAEQCWTSCCCLKPSQRARWAQEKGITPPSYAILSDSKQVVHNTQLKTKDCCTASTDTASPRTPAPKCCQPKSRQHCEACQQKDTQTDVAQVSTLKDNDDPQPTRFALIMLAFKCKGINFGFSSLPVFELPSPLTLPSSNPRIETNSIANASPVRVFTPVPIPPPKL
jgi:hypothetical protein